MISDAFNEVYHHWIDHELMMMDGNQESICFQNGIYLFQTKLSHLSPSLTLFNIKVCIFRC